MSQSVNFIYFPLFTKTMQAVRHLYLVTRTGAGAM